MNNQSVSVIIPLYNKAKHIIRCINSVLAQTYPIAEIIIVDDGSTDNGATLIEQANIENVTLIKKSNGGVSSARNLGIRKAKSEYIAFLDADDEWMPMFIEQMLQLAQQFPIAGAFASRYQYVIGDNKFKDAKINVSYIPNTGYLIDDFYAIASMGDLPFLVCSMLIKSDVIKEVGFFPEGETMGEDQDFICRIVDRYRVAYSKNINMLYHIDASNRACENNLPDTECPFSQRVMQRIHVNRINSRSKALTRIRFCAAHICHLAKRNLLAGKPRVALALLKDNRTWTKPIHKVVLSIMSVVCLPLVHE